jgi:L-histidine N-alpha-methyltransferase
VSNELAAEYPGVSILPIAADYTQPIELPALPAGARRLAFFPGSTIGNFHPTEAAAFLSRIRRTLGSAGALVLGVDRRKDASVLDRAYDDSAGVTAAFNRNVLTRLNREYGATFDVGSFSHRAFFNETASRVEMHLVSLADQTATLGDRTIRFERGETIWTESSYKYDARRLEELVAEAGFRIERLWTDPRDLFWVALLSVG